MVKYENGKIYRLVCNITGQQYIGSTCSTLPHRKGQHKSEYKCFLDDKRKNICSSLKILENGNYDIILIENYPCNDKNELLSRERYFIETMECVNKIIPAKTKEELIESRQERDKNYYWKNKEIRNINAKQWRENNKEKHSIQKKNYYDNNKEVIKDKNKKYYENNKETIQQRRKDYIKKYCEKNKEEIIKKQKERYEKNKEEIIKKQKERYEKNKEKISQQKKEYYLRKKEKLLSKLSL
jgi:hypothetical protein